MTGREHARAWQRLRRAPDDTLIGRADDRLSRCASEVRRLLSALDQALDDKMVRAGDVGELVVRASRAAISRAIARHGFTARTFNATLRARTSPRFVYDSGLGLDDEEG